MEDDEEDVMILRSFLVCLVNVSVLLFFFLLYFECFSKTNCFCFQKHYTTVSFVYDIYVTCYCVSFWINRIRQKYKCIQVDVTKCFQNHKQKR